MHISLNTFIFVIPIRATRFGKKKFVDILLDAGASVDVRNNFGSTPLHLACEYGHHDVVKVDTYRL